MVGRHGQPIDQVGTFEPQLVRKGRRRFEGFDEKILAPYSPLGRVQRVQCASTRSACRAYRVRADTLMRALRPQPRDFLELLDEFRR